MAIDLTAVTAAEMQVNRLELPDDAAFEFGYHDDVSGWTQLFTLDQSGTYDWDARSIDNLAVAKDFVRMQIIDFDGLKPMLDLAEATKYGEYLYKVSRVDPPFGATRVWTIKLERSETLS